MIERNEALAVDIAKAFCSYDDLEWARLEPIERNYLTEKGRRAADALLRRGSDEARELAREIQGSDHCHGIVTRDGIEDVCGKPPVAIIDARKGEDQCYWPACAYHAHRYGGRHVVPLRDIAAALVDPAREAGGR